MPSLFITINAIISGCISFFSSIVNILIIVTFLTTKRLQNVNNTFLFQLAVVDLTKAVFVLGVRTYTQLKEEQIVGFFCPFSGFIGCITSVHSALLLAAIAVVRYVKIVKPRTYERIFSKTRMICYCCALAFATIFLALLPIFGVGKYDYSKAHGICFARWIEENMPFRILFYVYVMGFCYPVLIFCYSFIFYSLRKHKSRVLANSRRARRISAIKNSNVALRKPDESYKKMENSTNSGEVVQDDIDIELQNNDLTKVVKWNIELNVDCKEAGNTNVFEESELENDSSENNEMVCEKMPEGSIKGPLEMENVMKEKGKISSPREGHKEKNKGSSVSRHAIRNEIRVTKIMFVVVVAFSICWLPAFFATLIQYAKGPGSVSETAFFVIVILVDIKVLLNPLIYGIWNKQFRDPLKALFLKGIGVVSISSREGDSRASNSQSQTVD